MQLTSMSSPLSPPPPPLPPQPPPPLPQQPPPPLVLQPLAPQMVVEPQVVGVVGADMQQKRALEDAEDAGKRKARRMQVKNKCEHDRWKDGRCKECLCKHKVKRGDCKDGCNEVQPIV